MNAANPKEQDAMRLNLKAKIEACCSTDEMRENLASPYLDLTNKDDPRLVACDGHVLVALKVTPHEQDATGWVSADALKAFRKSKPQGDAHMTANGKHELPGGATFPRPDMAEGSRFPDWRQVLPGPRDQPVSVSFDVNLLRRIVDACGSDGKVTLTFDASNAGAPISIEPQGSDAIAVMMPFRR